MELEQAVQGSRLSYKLDCIGIVEIVLKINRVEGGIAVCLEGLNANSCETSLRTINTNLF